jgi:AraC-like DNA-binding protein
MNSRNSLFSSALARLASAVEKGRREHQVYRMGVGRCVPSQKNAPGPHYHESWELKIPLKGRIHCRFEDKSFDLAEHSALLIAPQTLHPQTAPGDIRRGGAWLNLLFENGDVRLMLMQGRRVMYYFLSSDQKSALTTLLGRPANEFCEHMAQVLEQDDHNASRKIASKWLSIFFSSLITAISAPPVSSPQHEIVSRAIALLNNMSNDASLTITSMAALLDISPKYLSAVFHRLTGVTPRQKLIRIRLERAFRLLKAGKFSVKEVAAMTGWRNQFYFSSSFRRHYGVSPARCLPGR